MISRRLREAAKRGFHTGFAACQRLGVDVLPRHFYSQIPDVRSLRSSEGWRQPRSMYGIAGASIEEQVGFVNEVCEREARSTPSDLYERSVAANGEDGGFGLVEAAFLYCFIRATRPRRVVQVGCGVSTAVILEAATSVGHDIAVTCVDPFPTPYLQRLGEVDPRVSVVAERAQDVALDVLTDLGPGDLFFMDSTHTVKPDSEVNRVVFEVLPRLDPDIWVHVHDIYFPFDYAPDLLSNDLFFWSETALLYSFLVNNPGYRLCVAQSMIHHEQPEALSRYFSHYVPRATSGGLFTDTVGEFPASLYLRSVRP
ncbi:MAG: class I SAM-dependent methyltransferase [Acidimicrobiales bacterium]